MEELDTHAPDVLPAVRASVAARHTDLDFIRLGVEQFAAGPSISLDYAVAERTSRAAVVPADIGWSDVGSWSALWELGAKDAAGNVTLGDVVLEGAENCYVRADNKLAAVIGLKDVVLVSTEDAVLAMHRDHAQDVKKIVDRLKAAGRSEATAHNRGHRPWGFYESLIQGDRFQVKRIVVQPGRQLSLQSHYHRAEHWVVVNGTARVTRDSETMILRENESVYLPLGVRAPAGKSGENPPDFDRGAGGGVSGRGRYRPVRGYIRAGLTPAGALAPPRVVRRLADRDLGFQMAAVEQRQNRDGCQNQRPSADRRHRSDEPGQA